MASETSQNLEDLTLRTFESTLLSSCEFELLKAPWFHTRSGSSEWNELCANARSTIFLKRRPAGVPTGNTDMKSFALASTWVEAAKKGHARFKQVPLPRLYREPPLSRAFAMLTSLRSSIGLDGVLVFIEHYVAFGRSDNENPLTVIDLLQVRSVTAEVFTESSSIVFQLGDSEPRRLFPYTGKRVLGRDGPSPHCVAALLDRFAVNLRKAISPSLRALNSSLLSCFGGPIIPQSVVVVCGPVCAGKSTFLNGLLGTFLFPVDPQAETHFPTKLTFSRSMMSDAHVTLNYRGRETPEVFSASLKGAHDAIKRPKHASPTEIVSAHITLSVGCCRSHFQRIPNIERLEIIDLPGRGEERSASDGSKSSDDMVLMNMLRNAHNPVFVAINNMKHLNSEVNAAFLRTLTEHVSSIKQATLSSDKRVLGLALLRSESPVFPPSAQRTREEWQRSADLFTEQIVSCGITAYTADHSRGICMDSRIGLALHIVAQHERLTIAGHDVSLLLEALQVDEVMGFDFDDISDMRIAAAKAKVAIDECETFVCEQRGAGTWSIPSLEGIHLKHKAICSGDWAAKFVGSEIALLSVLLQVSQLTTEAGYPRQPPSLSSDSRKVLENCIRAIVTEKSGVASLVSVYSEARAKEEQTKTALIVGAVVVGGVVTAGVGLAYAGSIGAMFAAEGLYGAAAVSSGLATLGGGSLASGGFGMAGGIFVISSASGLAGAAGAGLGASFVARSGQTASDLKVFVKEPNLISSEEINQGVPYNDCWYQNVDDMNKFLENYTKKRDELLKQWKPNSGPYESTEFVGSYQEMLKLLDSKELRYSGGVQCRLRCGHGVSYEQVEAQAEPLPLLECNWLPNAAHTTSHPVGVGVVPFRALVEWGKQYDSTRRVEIEFSEGQGDPDFILVQFNEDGSLRQACCFSEEVLAHNYECKLSIAVAEARMLTKDGV